MEKDKLGRSEPGPGRASADILSRIRETAASKPEQQVRQLTEENCRLVYELGIAQVDLARSQGEQEQLVAAYDALEKRYDADVGQLTKELEKLTLVSAAVEKDRDGLDPESSGPPEELKDIADKSKRCDDGTSVEVGPDTDSSIPLAQAMVTHPSEQQIHRLEQEVEQLKAQLNDAETRIKASSPMQGKHPVDLQVLSPARDPASMAKVIEKVSRLNAQILQAGDLFGEIVVFSPLTLAPEARKRYTEVCDGAIDSMLTRCLSHEASKNETNGVNQFLARLVFRVLLTNLLYLLVDVWEPADLGLNEYIAKLYFKIRDAEEQSISGRWKALTKKYTGASTDLWKERLLGRLESVCGIAKWSIVDEGRSAFSQKLSTIIIAAEDLRAAVGELGAYVDIHILRIPQDKPFGQRIMEDAYAGKGNPGAGTRGRPHSQEVVVGSVGFGVMRGSKERLPNGKMKYNFIKPAKVVLLSTLLACCSTCSAAAKPKSASTFKATSTTPGQAIPQGGSASPGRPTGISGAKGPGAGTGGDAGNVNRKTNTPAGQEKKWWRF